MTSSARGRERERSLELSTRIADLRDRLAAARSRTWELIDPLSDDDTRKQHNPLMSPIVWDVAHIGNFEELWLVRELGKRASMSPLYDEMYDAFKNPRRDRVHLPLLDRQQCRTYLQEVRQRALAQLERLDTEAPDPLLRDGYVYEMVIQHEYQHTETMLATLQLMAEPGYRPALPPTLAGQAPNAEMTLVGEGAFIMGTEDRVCTYDNERPAHQIWLPSFWIDTTPVTNAAYFEFIQDHGYARPGLWALDGQRWLAETGAESPQFWECRDGTWWVNVFGHWRPLNPRQPVQHVCYWEADAFARWRGKRLPTEAEWEKAASWDPEQQAKRDYPWGDEAPTAAQANLDQRAYGPMEVGAYPRGVSAYGCHQMIGDVWEWVSSDFTGYPGFEAFPYKEYSEVFFGPDYKVLRGGSWATPPGAIRTTFRNWDFPIRRQIFSGFRCARDAQ